MEAPTTYLVSANQTQHMFRPIQDVSESVLVKSRSRRRLSDPVVSLSTGRIVPARAYVKVVPGLLLPPANQFMAPASTAAVVSPAVELVGREKGGCAVYLQEVGLTSAGTCLPLGPIIGGVAAGLLTSFLAGLLGM